MPSAVPLPVFKGHLHPPLMQGVFLKIRGTQTKHIKENYYSIPFSLFFFPSTIVIFIMVHVDQSEEPIFSDKSLMRFFNSK